MGLLGEDQLASAQVADRDLQEPRRLGVEDRDALERRLREALPELEAFVGERLQATCSAEVAGLREIHADRVAGQLEEPLAVLRFRVNGQPGWLVWQNPVAVAALETLLGSPGKVGEGRTFTRVEEQVLAGILTGVAGRLVAATGQEVQEGVMVGQLRTLGSWRDAGPGADAHRLAIDLTLHGIGEEPSEMQLYVPGVGANASADEPVQALPEHLGGVDVEIVVHLGETEVPLSQLLEIEEGDVIPLGTPRDGLLSLSIDGWELAKARLGHRDGHLAVAVIEPVETPPALEPGTENPS